MKRGEVYIAVIPTVDGSPAKSRPCVVVQANYYNERIANTLVAPITSNLKRRDDPAHLLIDVSTPEGKASGLHSDSLVTGLNVVVVMKKHLQKRIGKLSEDAMEKVDACLRVALGIN